MMIVRKGGPSSGYISTGFYSGKYLARSFSCIEHIIGLTLGRVILVGLTKKVEHLLFYLGESDRSCTDWKHLRHLPLCRGRFLVSTSQSYHSDQASRDITRQVSN